MKIKDSDFLYYYKREFFVSLDGKAYICCLGHKNDWYVFVDDCPGYGKNITNSELAKEIIRGCQEVIDNEI